MCTKAICWPPLGQSTVVNDTVDFKVLLATEEDIASCGVTIWHNHNGHDQWSGLDLRPEKDHQQLLIGSDPHIAQRWFYGRLSRNHLGFFSFTLRYRLGRPDDGWQWINDEIHIADGVVHYLSAQPRSSLQDYLPHLSNDISTELDDAETSNTLLFHLTAEVGPANGDEAGHASYSLGRPADYVRWTAITRHNQSWLGPRQGANPVDYENDGVMTSFLRQDGMHVVCLAVSGMRHVTTWFRTENGELVIDCQNDATDRDQMNVLVAIASSFEVANAAVMYRARSLVTPLTSEISDTASKQKQLISPIKTSWQEHWADGLTWCTWEAIGQQMDESRLLSALEDLSKDSIKVTNLIIDDGWQSISDGKDQHHRCWQRFEADQRKFPRGLKSTVMAIQDRYPHIHHVAVWHAMLGYWRGIDPHGEIASRYATQTATMSTSKNRPFDGDLTLVNGSDVTSMYGDFYRFLVDCGIDGVKTDVQSYLEMVNEASARRENRTSYLDGWTVARLRHFSGRAISSMSSTPHTLFYSLLPKNKPPIVLRNSDDFWPNIEDSHRWHIFCNANNALLTQHLNALPDWDMFQTRHKWAHFHAAARAISGGPVCFTDVPGKQDTALLNELSARTIKGATIVLRPHRPGKSLNPYLSASDPGLTRVGTYVGHAQTGSGMMGVFNCTTGPVAEIVRLEDFPGTKIGISYIVHNYEDGRLSEIMEIGGLVVPRLRVQGWAIMTAHPVHFHTQGKKRVASAALGLVDKMSGAAALLGYHTNVERSGRLRLKVTLKALGVLGVFIDDLSARSVDDGIMVLIFGRPADRKYVAVSASEKVLEIDVVRAWEMGGFDAGWNNEVVVEIFLS